MVPWVIEPSVASISDLAIDRSRSRSCILWLGCLCIALGVARARGDDWTSSDGVIEVTIPNSGFTRVENPPTNFLALWISHDETIRLGVAQIPYPRGAQLLRTNLEKGIAGAGAEITASSTSTKDGHEVWGNSTASSIEGVKNIGQTSIVRVNDSIYQIVAITAADAAVDETIVPTFLDSLVVKGPHHPNGLAGLDRNETSDEKFGKFYKSLGRSMGMLLLLILLVGVIARFILKERRIPPPASVSR